MTIRSFAGALLCAAALLTGCATRTPMAFESDSEQVTATSKPIYLMTATLKNTYKDYQPKMLVVHVEKPGAKEAADRLNFVLDPKAKAESNAVIPGNTYYLRMPLDPGKYELVGMSSIAGGFPIMASFFTPVHSQIDVATPGVYYLGHLNATVRERVGDEFKAGPSIPLVDQAVAGASGGTFDVEIVDLWGEDEGNFRARFPALKGVEVKKAILPPFDRAKAQQWWEAH